MEYGDIVMKNRIKNVVCVGAVLGLLGWTVRTILREQTPGQLAAAWAGFLFSSTCGIVFAPFCRPLGAAFLLPI